VIGVLSDAHGNAHAFDEAIRVLRSKGATRFVYLGDALGYFPNPYMLNRVREACGPDGILLGGNHEAMIADESTPPDRESAYQHAAIRRWLPIHDLEHIRRLPSRVECSMPSGRALFVHGSPEDPLEGYVYEDSCLIAPGNGVTHVICGHTHRPFIRLAEGVTWVNVGSCGLPRDDGAIGSAALLDPISGKASLLRFDIEGATRLTIEEFGAPHDSVLRVLDRRSTIARKSLSQ
jgi:predicted phosphodiesterase